jgi:DNA adenine methylase
MNGGPIGGVKQTGPWKLAARFNKAELHRRCERVVEYGERVQVSGLDGIEFIRAVDTQSTMLFLDPPYYVKGQTLYMNALDDAYHQALATQLKAMRDQAWVLTYDDCPEVREMYRGWARIRPFALRYAAAERRHGREVLIVPDWMKLPSSQGSAAVTW